MVPLSVEQRGRNTTPILASPEVMYHSFLSLFGGDLWDYGQLYTESVRSDDCLVKSDEGIHKLVPWKSHKSNNFGDQ